MTVVWYELQRADHSVFVFGARVDASTDDIDAINNALAWSAETGFTILQPVGTMMVDTSTNIPTTKDPTRAP